MGPSEIQSFCSRLPKVELHAHLNGSFSEKTLYSLYMDSPGCKTEDIRYLISSFHQGSDRTLDDCFKNFDIAHAVTISPAAVRRGTMDVISEFASDGVIYLELRTTPRTVPGVMSKKQYIQAVVDAIRDVPNFIGPERFIIVKLLLSVNRRDERSEAEANIKEAVEAHMAYPDIVVGVDLSGDPKCGTVAENILPLFADARSKGLKVALHCAEVPNEKEVEAIIRFKADRIGHGTCIHPQYGGSEKLWTLLLESKVPIEVCLTSNIKCKTVENYESHHLQHLLPVHHPIAISTDDKGVFCTTLSKEFEIAAETFLLSFGDLCRFTEMAIDASFASPDEKNQLLEKLNNFKVLEGIHCVE
ncbi:hypothetical protein ONE63_002245 [Megalurothrips usitatus]|uniref:Adenosine deaminase domain-containing protein n=1 Tax=Megalurothrips usitatus TaxID=439358 RepID=A0AAV7XDM0_9NEOP|nr:hypothetical protein ONE63_002245 [Megalurothrips usitatus]